jgi:hypothetical protein
MEAWMGGEIILEILADLSAENAESAEKAGGIS